MRTWSILSLFVFFLLLPGMASGSGAGSQVLDKDDLFRIFEKYVVAQSPWPAADLEIKKFKVRPEELHLPHGEVEYRLAGSSPDKHPGHKNLDLIVSVGGKDLGRVKFSGELHLYGVIACTVRKVGRGDELGREDIKMVRSDLTWQSVGVVYDPAEAVGNKLRSSLRAGSVLLEKHLEAPPLVNRGDTVTIVAGKTPLMVTAPGRIKDGGAMGELVRVKNMMSRKVLLARVRDDRTVVVDY